MDEEEEKSNIQKLKEKLIELKIPAEQIKIKTANINEIKGIDLLSKKCEVRFITHVTQSYIFSKSALLSNFLVL